VAPTLGSDAYTFAAAVAINVLVLAESMPRETQLSHAAFVASAFEMLAVPRELPFISFDHGKKLAFVSASELTLAQTARMNLVDAILTSKLDGEVLLPMLDAWQRVVVSGAVTMRQLGNDLKPAEDLYTRLAAAAAEAAVRGLRECALAGCASKEVHVSQFKRCGACRTVAYCCREHQLEDWPAHKAACKAARKEAAGKS
jgi:hypothetical protein